MQVMIEVTNPLAREQTMTKVQDKAKIIAIKELLERDEDFVRAAVQSLVQAALEAEMTEALGAEKGERTDGRLGYRSGYYQRALITRGPARPALAVGKLRGEDLARPSQSGLKTRGLSGVEFVVSDDHAGLKAAIREVLPEAVWQRCYVHFLRKRSITSRARWTMTACANCAGSTTGASWPRFAAA
jgi:transposase-like protein